ncbi:MAG TPA: AMP-binding protein [Acidimicrobiales bacterium]
MLLHDLPATAEPAARALTFGDEHWSFARLTAEIDRVATAVTVRTDAGDRVGLVGRNRLAYVAALYGIPAAGRIAVPLNHRLAPAEIAAQAEYAGTTVVIGDRGDDGLDGAVPWAEWSTEVAASPPSALRGGPAPDDPAWILFTSGTTGRAKGAVLTHRSLLAAVEGANAARPVADDDVYGFCFSLCHVAAYNVFCLHAAGRPVVITEGFDPAELARVGEREPVTTVSLAPTMLAMLLDHLRDDAGAGRNPFATLRQLAYGASSMAPELLRRGAETLGVGFAQGYGMTELSGNAVFLDAEAHRSALTDRPHLLRAAGKPSPVVKVRIAGDGEILVRGPQVMAGYWDDPEATAATIVNGWLHTGDFGEIDAEGYLYVVDRAKDIVVTGGENVSSREVEEVLADHPGVATVAVIGVPDERWGEAVCAVIVPVPSAEPSLEDLVAFTRGRLGGFKQPRRLVLVSGLPVNAAGKVLKRELRAEVTADG